MARIINTREAADQIATIISGAKSLVVLVSPYVDPQRVGISNIRKAAESGKKIFIVCRKRSLRPDVEEELRHISNLFLVNHDSIHAKCYFNETRLVISSLNWYEHSIQNNLELGTLFELHNSPDLFLNALMDAVTNLNVPEVTREVQPLFGKTVVPVNRSAFERMNRLFHFKPLSEKGTCIRCKTTMPVMNGNFPFCETCFYEWSRVYDFNSAEKYCHWCAGESRNATYPVTKRKPLCLSCFRKYQEQIKIVPPAAAQDEAQRGPRNEPTEATALPPPSTLSTPPPSSSSHPAPSRKKNRLILGGILLVLVITACYYLFNNPLNAGSSPDMGDPRVAIIRQYYQDESMGRLDPDVYFAPRVEKFFLLKNLTSSEIRNALAKSADEFMHPQAVPLDSGIVVQELQGGRANVRVWITFSCFRKSKKQYQYCKVLHEFRFDGQNRITGLQELEVRDLEFSFRQKKKE